MWRKLQRGEVCPACRNDSWCTIASDGTACKCMRIPSEKPVHQRDGTIGYVHRLDEPIKAVEVAKRSRPKMSIEEVTEIADEAFHHPSAKRARARLAESLGVTVQSLEALYVGWGIDQCGKTWTSWPCRDWEQNIVGIVRRYRDGSKLTMKNTRTGLFIPIGMELRSDLVLIVEGGSDTAAAASVGLLAVGRPSNIGGAEWIKKWLAGRRCIVVGENDEQPQKRGRLPQCPVTCQGCGHCFPGWHGAKLVAKQLKCGYMMPPVWAKDFRVMVRGVK